MKKILITLIMAAGIVSANEVVKAHFTMCAFYNKAIAKHEQTYFNTKLNSVRKKSSDAVAYYSVLKLMAGCHPEFEYHLGMEQAPRSNY